MKNTKFADSIKSLKFENSKYLKLIALNKEFKIYTEDKINFGNKKYFTGFIKYCEDKNLLDLNTLLILKNNFQPKYIYIS